MAVGPRDKLVSRNSATTKHPGPIMWHYLRDPTFSCFRTTPECDRHTQKNRRTDKHTTTACTALSIASRGKNRPYYTAHQV